MTAGGHDPRAGQAGVRADVEVDVGGTVVLDQRGGDGAPLLFLHGEGRTWAWGALHDELARRFRVHAPVHPGFGGSELPGWLTGIEDLAFHYVDVLDAIGLGRPLVVGESFGGWVAFQLAAQRPDRVRALVLAGALGLRADLPVPDLFIKPGPEAIAYLSERLDGSVVDPIEGDADAATELWLDQAAQARLMWERPYDPKWERRAHHVHAPTRVVWGALDRLLPPDHGTRLAALMGASPPLVVPGAGHLVSVDAPVELATAVSTFADEVDHRERIERPERVERPNPLGPASAFGATDRTGEETG